MEETATANAPQQEINVEVSTSSDDSEVLKAVVIQKTTEGATVNIAEQTFEGTADEIETQAKAAGLSIQIK